MAVYRSGSVEREVVVETVGTHAQRRETDTWWPDKSGGNGRKEALTRR